MSEPWEGLLPIDKPAGPTSHDLVAWIRSATGVRRVGHTGTLDPPATGLLLLLLGRATRLARFVPDSPKIYRGVLALGVTTTTDDISGEVVHRYAGTLPSRDEVLSAARLRLGRQMQVPPAYSARQVGGTRMYRLARRGVAVEAPATEVVVDRFELSPTGIEDRWAYEIVVSTGTYVRAAVRDLGVSLGCGAAVASLRRIAIGPMSVDDAMALPTDRANLCDAVAHRLIPIDAMPLDLPAIAIDSPEDVRRFCAGGTVPTGESEGEVGELAAVRDARGRLLGVATRGGRMLKPQMVLPPTA